MFLTKLRSLSLKTLQNLLEWINSELAEKRIVVREIDEDLYDGQILSILMGNVLFKTENICIKM